MNQVIINIKAQKQIKKLPEHIVQKLQKWAEDVEQFGIEEIRIIPGYHDELLKWGRSGQRSIRLSKAYRAFLYETPSRGHPGRVSNFVVARSHISLRPCRLY